MFGFGCLMIEAPLQFSRGIALFSEKLWFHPFEIISRAIFGVLCLTFATNAPHSTLLYLIGGVLCFSSIFLVIIGSDRHKKFAILTSRIGNKFRVLGLVAVLCGFGLNK